MITVEIRDDSGVTTSRLRVEESDFTIGRSPDCAVVVDDPFVDARHLVVARLEDRSGVSIHDSGSKNGTRVAGAVISSEPVSVPWGAPIVIGQTTLILRDPDAPVAEAQALPANDGRLFDYTRIPAWTTTALAVAMLALWTGSSMYAPIGWEEGLGLVIGMFGLLMLWTGFWAGVSRLFAGRARFRTHLGFAAAFVLVTVPLTVPFGWVVFAADHPVVDVAVNWILLGLVLWTVPLFGHIDIASRRGLAFKVGLACVLSIAVSAMGVAFLRAEGTPVDQVQRSLLVLTPVPDGMTRTESLEDFLAEIEELPAEHDRDIEKAASK